MKKNYFVTSALATVAKILTDKYKLTVSFKGSVPCTNGKSITLPAVSDELSKSEQYDLLAYTVHEVGHILFTDFKYAWEFQQLHGQAAFGLLNSLEDTRIERLMELDYAGAERLLKESYKRLKISFEQQTPPVQLQQFGSMLYLIGRGYDIPLCWDTQLLVRAMQYKDLIAKATKAKRTREVAEIVLKILSEIQDLIPAPPKQKTTTVDNNSTEPGIMSGSSSFQGAVDSTSDDSKSKGGNTDIHGSGGGVEAHSGSVKPEIQGVRDQIVSNIADSCATILSTNTNTAFRQYDSSSDQYRVPTQASPLQLFEAEALVQPHVRAVRSKLISALVAQGRTRWLSNQSDGAIDVTKLPELMAGTSEKVFKKRVTGKSKEVAVTLLIDTSGSMKGYRMEMANAVALLFADTLHRAQIRCRVVGFNGARRVQRGLSQQEYDALRKQYSHVAPVHYGVVKEFHEPFRKVKSRFPSLKATGNTPLAPALLQELRLLLQRKEDRKILMVLTDGEPNGDGNLSTADNIMVCKEMLTQAERLGVESVGIGICVDVDKIFQQVVRVDRLSELPKKTIKELHKVLLPRR